MRRNGDPPVHVSTPVSHGCISRPHIPASRGLRAPHPRSAGREELEGITAKYPDRQKALRWAVIRLATRRAIVLHAKMEKSRSQVAELSASAKSRTSLLASGTPTFDRLLNECTIAKNDMEVAIDEVQQDTSLHLQQDDGRQMSRRDHPAVAIPSPILSSAGASVADFGAAVEEVRAIVDGMGVDQVKVQQAIQRLGSEGQAHGAALLRVSEEVHSLRDAIERLTQAVGSGRGIAEANVSRRRLEPSRSLGKVASTTRFAQAFREKSSKSSRAEGELSSRNGSACASRAAGGLARSGSEKVSDAI